VNDIDKADGRRGLYALGMTAGVIVLAIVLVILFGNSPDHAPKPTAPAETQTHKPTPGEIRATKNLLRVMYAKNLDKAFLDAGIESRTEAAGKDRSTLQIVSPLASRVMANQISEKLDWDYLGKIGFRRVVLTNDLDGELRQSYTWKVGPPQGK
jgi:hypothetical protein